MGKFWSTWAAICFAALAAIPVRAEVITDLAPFTWDSARPRVLVLEGVIDGRTPTLLKRALTRFPSVTTLSLFSEGGSTYAALPMAYEVRDAGLKTTIPAGGTCASACSYLFFAGVERSASGPLGVHRIVAGNNNLDQGQRTLGDIFGAFEEFGVPTTVIARMMQTPPDEMHLFTPDELVALGLIGRAASGMAPVTAPLDPPQPDLAPVVAPLSGPATHIALDTAGEADGRVVIELFDDVAPKHAERLVRLAREGAYDGVVFYRVIDGFMAQTGDVEFGKADGDLSRAGTGGSSYPDLPAEFSDKPFGSGAVGMARTKELNSANSQFFIMFGPAPHLDGSYTAVGQVVEGLDVARTIKQVEGENGAVDALPDRIVSAKVMGELHQPTKSETEPEPEIAGAELRRILAYHFDFTDKSRISIDYLWELPADLGEFVGCQEGGIQALKHGYSQCAVTLSFGRTEAAQTVLDQSLADGMSYQEAADGSREIIIDWHHFFGGAGPPEAERKGLSGADLSFIVFANNISETTGELSEGGKSTRFRFPFDLAVDESAALPDPFVTRFR